MWWAIGGLVVGGLLGAWALFTYLVSTLTGKTWWEVWKP